MKNIDAKHTIIILEILSGFEQPEFEILVQRFPKNKQHWPDSADGHIFAFQDFGFFECVDSETLNSGGMQIVNENISEIETLYIFYLESI